MADGCPNCGYPYGRNPFTHSCYAPIASTATMNKLGWSTPMVDILACIEDFKRAYSAADSKLQDDTVQKAAELHHTVMFRQEAAVGALLAEHVDLSRIKLWSETSSNDCGVLVDCPDDASDAMPYKACTISVRPIERDGGYFLSVSTEWHGEWRRLA